MMGILHEDQYTFFIMSCSVLRMRNVLVKVEEKIEVLISWSIEFFKKLCLVRDIVKTNLCSEVGHR
jgi:hypothetical protein